VLALAYADLHYLRNAVVTIVRSPGRLAIWAPYVIFIGLLAFSRAMRGASRTQLPWTTIPPTVATAAAGACLFILGLTLLLSGVARIRAFRSPGEAILVNNAGIGMRPLVIWLQLRKLASAGPAWLGTFAYLLLVIPRLGATSLTGRIAIASFLLAAVISTVQLPLQLARGPMSNVVRALGALAITAGAAWGGAGLAASLGAPNVLAQISRVIPLDPGRGLTALLGDSLALAAAGMIPLGLIALAPAFAGDIMPELYAAATTGMSLRERLRSGRIAMVRSFQPTSGAGIPPGALSLFWKDWIGLRRRPMTLRLLIVLAILWAIGGAALARPNSLFGIGALAFPLVTTGLMVAVLAPAMNSFGLFEDVANPLWWLSSATLRRRLFARTLSKAWPGATTLALLPLAFGLASHRPVIALAALPAAFALRWPLQTLSALVYALFPSPIDSRGPLRFAKFLLVQLYLTPPVVAAILLSLYFHNALLGVGLALALLVLEGITALELAVRRISQNGAGLGRLERAGV
jgi:hypothetical protein